MNVSRDAAPIRVLHVTAVGETAAIIVGPLIRHQLARGYAVEVACARSPLVEGLINAGVTLHDVPFSRRLLTARHVAALIKLVRVIRAGKYDVVHAHTPVAAFLARIAARSARVPVVIYHLRGSFWDARSAWIRSLYTTAERFAARFTTHVLTINCTDAEEVVRRGVMPVRSVTCLHCGGSGVDLERFSPSRVTAVDRERLRHELRIGTAEIVIGFIGRLVSEKGVSDLLRAFEIVLGSHPRAHLLLVGSTLDSDRDRNVQRALETRVLAGGISRRVTFAGFRTDIPAVLSVMDIVVLPSYREGFGMVLAEAMAMEKPVVATATRGAREIVRPGLSGLLVPIGNPRSLADALDRLCRDATLRRHLGSTGRKLVVQQLSMTRVCADIDRIYAELLVERGVETRSSRARYIRVKRIVDVLLASLLLLPALPLMFITAIAVWVTLGRPILFTQRRPGLHGVPFTLLKFRTMREPPARDGHVLADAARLTPVGRLLRSLSLDELPELLNVLRGDMSLVGPRPLLMQYLERYTPGQARRHEVKPGITGWAQVHGRNALSWERRFELDAWYIDHVSLWLDLRILALTAWRVVTRQGVSAPGQATMTEFMGSGRCT